MALALILLAALAWWLHQRGELLPNLARWGGTAAAGMIALRLLETGKPAAAAIVAGLGYAWWRMQAPRAGAVAAEAAARRLLGVGPDAGADTIQAAWRAAIARAHPDAGGSDEAARAVTAARDLLLARSRMRSAA